MNEKPEIITVTIKDKQGNVIGSITGRKDEVSNLNKEDLRSQIESDKIRHKDNLRR